MENKYKRDIYQEIKKYFIMLTYTLTYILQVKIEFINKILSPKAKAILNDTGVARSDTEMTSSKKKKPQPSNKLYTRQTLCVCVKHCIHLPVL